MFTITDTIEAGLHRNDFLRSISDPKRAGDFAEGEVRIRKQLRKRPRQTEVHNEGQARCRQDL
jgi:hypothetical protein